MKKIVLTLTAAIIFAWQGPSFAASSSVDALIQKLEDKGILTEPRCCPAQRSNFF